MALLQWQNLIFILPMAAGLLYVLLMAMGLSLGEHSDLAVDHDLGIDHDVGIDHDMSVEHDVGAGHDVHAGHAVPDTHLPEGAHAHHPHLFGKALGLVGVGKVPVSILMISVCFVWGAVGLVLNAVLGTENMVKVAAYTALAALVGTRLLAESLASLLPGEESYYTRKEELVGETGDVLYEVTPVSGTVRLRDSSGNLVDLDCRSSGEEHIAAGARVVIGEYNEAADWFTVSAEG